MTVNVIIIAATLTEGFCWTVIKSQNKGSVFQVSNEIMKKDKDAPSAGSGKCHLLKSLNMKCFESFKTKCCQMLEPGISKFCSHQPTLIFWQQLGLVLDEKKSLGGKRGQLFDICFLKINHVVFDQGDFLKSRLENNIFYIKLQLKSSLIIPQKERNLNSWLEVKHICTIINAAVANESSTEDSVRNMQEWWLVWRFKWQPCDHKVANWNL